MSDEGAAPDLAAARRLVLRGVAVTTVLVLASMMGLIAWFAIETERAHDEANCPFVATGRTGSVGEVVVVEDARSCVRNISEHRWRLEGSSADELGRRRLPSPAYDPDGGYRWSAEATASGAIEVVVSPAGGTEVFRVAADR